MEIYEASVRAAFGARHAIRLADGSLEPSHEHLWEVQAAFRAERLDPATHVVIDFVEVKDALDRISAEFEGADLNSMHEFSAASPTAELVARMLAQKLLAVLSAGGMLYMVRVSEAPGCHAAYYPSGA
ncbi:MAG: 6-carboxytetrahydropterin synthase [Planctomycetes bacterium]|nr:6-carboxytetrahydropterin synthase [Planctomycetota bacterium]